MWKILADKVKSEKSITYSLLNIVSSAVVVSRSRSSRVTISISSTSSVTASAGAKQHWEEETQTYETQGTQGEHRAQVDGDGAIAPDDSPHLLNLLLDTGVLEELQYWHWKIKINIVDF